MKTGNWPLWLAAILGAAFGVVSQLAYRISLGDLNELETPVLIRVLAVSAVIWATAVTVFALIMNNLRK